MKSRLLVVDADGNASIFLADAPLGIKSLTLNAEEATASFYFAVGSQTLFKVPAGSIVQFDRDYFTDALENFVRVSGGTSGDKVVLSYGIWSPGERKKVLLA